MENISVLIYSNNKFKISAPTWNDTFDLPDGSYFIADIQDYFEFIIKKHETLTENPLVQIYPNKIKNMIVFKIKTGYKFELLSSETMKLLGNTKKDVDQDEDGDDVPKLESVEIALVHCNLVNNSYQQISKVIFTFVLNKQFGQLIDIAPYSLTVLGTTNTEFSFIEVWFTDKNSGPLEIEDNVNLTRIMGLHYKNEMFVDEANHIYTAMPMYNLIEYSDNYSDTSGSLCQFKKDIAANNVNLTIDNSGSFKYKAALAGKTADAVGGTNSSVKNTKIIFPLKYLSNF